MFDRWGVDTDLAGDWIDSAPLVHARYKHVARLLGDGRVLVRGGFRTDHDDGTRFGSEVKVDVDEVWDPESGLWRVVPPLLADELARGAVASEQNEPPFHHEESHEMANIDYRTVRRQDGVFIPVAGGILIAGGYITATYADSSMPSDNLQALTLLFRPDDRFQVAGAIGTPRMWPAGVRLADGRVLLAGGCDERMTRTVYDVVEIWEPA